MKKTIFTLSVDNYSPMVTDITFPWLKRYAKKIGADFQVITNRKFRSDGLPSVIEKLQIFELGRKSDWNIYIDADCLVHPDFFDVTELLTPDTVLHNATDFALNRFKYDDYFRRDGRNIGSCNWFTIAHRQCLDLWRPPDISYKQAIRNIRPVRTETRNKIKPEHLLDDYILSRNIARFGLKVKLLRDLLTQLGNGNGEYLWHPFGDLDEMLKRIGVIDASEQNTEQKKVLLLQQVLRNWKLA